MINENVAHSLQLLSNLDQNIADITNYYFLDKVFLFSKLVHNFFKSFPSK